VAIDRKLISARHYQACLGKNIGQRHFTEVVPIPNVFTDFNRAIAGFHGNPGVNSSQFIAIVFAADGEAIRVKGLNLVGFEAICFGEMF